MFIKKKKKKNVFNTAVGSVLDVLFPDSFRKKWSYVTGRCGQNSVMMMCRVC